MEEAVFAGGCFWCIQPTFDALDGVAETFAGYSGGREAAPSYRQVKAQQTGHRESLCIRYDPARIGYEDLLRVFLENVDPFDGEGQFIDRGRSYTLAVYWRTERERTLAEDACRRLSAAAGRPVFVSVEPFRGFWPAEEEHQKYYAKHPEEFARELRDSGRTAD